MEIKETTFGHLSKSDNLTLSVMRIEPADPTEIKGIVQLVHGMNEYKERYRDFMNFLASNGYLTIIHDHRGHGHSVKNPDDLGYMYASGYVGIVKDIHEITIVAKTYAERITGRSDLPFILLGHSMGSMAVRCYIRKFDDEIDKLCVIGSPSNQPAAKAGLIAIRLFEKIKGDRARMELVAGMVMGNYEKRFKKEGIPHSWVNSDLEEVKKYNADPYCNYCFTLNGFENLVKLTMLTYKDGGHQMKNPDLPIRFFSGEQDPCAVNTKAFMQAVDFLKKQGYRDVEGKMYYNMRHEILNEPKHQSVYDDILAFINEQVL